MSFKPHELENRAIVPLKFYWWKTIQVGISDQLKLVSQDNEMHRTEFKFVSTKICMYMVTFYGKLSIDFLLEVYVVKG